MAKLVLTDLINLNNAQTTIAVVNANNAATEVAVEKTLSRDGTAPNEMNATLDMNSNRIINLPEPIFATEPVRKIDLDEATFGTGPGNGGTAGVTSIDGVQGSIVTGATLEMVGPSLQTTALFGAVTSPANSFGTTLANGVVTNAKMSNMNGTSFKGNHLSGLGPVQDISIDDLNQNVSPDPALDWVLCHDASSNTMLKMNINQIASSGAWVTSVEGQTGVVNLVPGTGIGIVAGSGGITITNTGDGPGTGAVDNVGGLDGSISLAPGLEPVPGINQLRIDDVWMKRPTGLSWYIGNAGRVVVSPAPGMDGQNNIGIGDVALRDITTGVQNVCIGSQAGMGITTGGDNIAIGLQALDRAKAVGSGLFVLNAVPSNGETVTIGKATPASDSTVYQRVYTFKTTPTVAGDVRINLANPTLSATNLINAINNTGGVPGTDYIVASAHSLVTASAPGLVGGTGPGAFFGITTKDPPPTGAGLDAFETEWNTQILTTTCADGEWSRPTIFGSGHAGSCIAIGSNALARNVAANNYAIGHSAGAQLTAASDSNILIGPAAGYALAEGIGNNTMIGYQTGYGHDTQTATYGYCTALGTFALQWCGWGAFNQTVPYPLENTAVGATAGLSITTGDSNTGIGANALGGNFEPSLDPNTGRLPITGSLNTAVGDSALRWVSSCGRNTAVGFRALFSRGPETSTYTPPPIPNEAVRGQIFHLTGNDNVALGSSALHTAVRTSTRNVAIGAFAIGQGTRPYVLANEADWSYAEYLADNFEGSGNIAIGAFSGYSLRQDPPPGSANPSKNIFIGDYTSSTNSLLQGITTGSNNVIIGGEIVGLGNVSNHVILATGIGNKVLWWDGINFKLPAISGTGLLQIDASGNVTAGGSPPGPGSGNVTGPGTTVVNKLATYADTTGNLLSDDIVGTATQVLHGSATGAVVFGSVNLATDISGNLPVGNLGGGTGATTSTFWRGDGQWAVPPSGGVGGGDVSGPGPTFIGRMAVYGSTDGTVIEDNIIGSATQVLHGGINGVVSFGAVNLATDVTGTLSKNNITGGAAATGSQFLAGDGVWKEPAALTGTSGGIPYYNTGTSIASTAALTNHGVVVGGGTGGAPSSISAGGAGQILISQGASAHPSWQPLGGAISMSGSTGTIVMNSGTTYPTPTLTGTVSQVNVVEAAYTFRHQPAAGAPTGDGLILGRIRFDGTADITPDPNVNRTYGAFYCQLLDNVDNISRLAWEVSNGAVAPVTGMTLGGLVTDINLTIPLGDIKVTGTNKGFTTASSGGYATIGSGGITTSGKLISTGGATTDGIGYGVGAGGTETQITSTTTGVVISPGSMCGTITTMPYTLAAGAVSNFPVTVGGMTATDNIIVTAQAYSGTGTPVIHAGGVTAGGFRIYVQNIHSVTALNDNLVINWTLIKSTNI